MTTNEAVEQIKEHIKYEARREIVQRYNATEAEIVDNFSFLKDGELKFRHYLGTVTTDNILASLYDQMINVCISLVPNTLIVPKNSGEKILRVLDEERSIRKPNKPAMGQELDIDESLAQIAVYETLGFFGINIFSQQAKELTLGYKGNTRLKI